MQLEPPILSLACGSKSTAKVDELKSEEAQTNSAETNIQVKSNRKGSSTKGRRGSGVKKGRQPSVKEIESEVVADAMPENSSGDPKLETKDTYTEGTVGHVLDIKASSLLPDRQKKKSKLEQILAQKTKLFQQEVEGAIATEGAVSLKSPKLGLQDIVDDQSSAEAVDNVACDVVPKPEETSEQPPTLARENETDHNKGKCRGVKGKNRKKQCW